MTKMVDIKKRNTSSDLTCCDMDEGYPWGTAIRLRDENYDGVSADGMNVGDLVEIHAYAKVTEKSSRETGDGESDKSMEFQCTQISVSRRTTSDSPEEVLYGDKTE